jgi:hypothetical protein
MAPSVSITISNLSPETAISTLDHLAGLFPDEDAEVFGALDEGGILKFPWDLNDAHEHAKAIVRSTARGTWDTFRTLVAHGQPCTVEDLVVLTGEPVEILNAKRARLGRTAYAHGEHANPISVHEGKWYVRPEVEALIEHLLKDLYGDFDA